MEELHQNEKLVNEEYKIWKKYSPFLYDLVITKACEWPSLSVQWLPDKWPAQQYTTWQLLFGTHAAQQDFESVLVAKVDIPNETYEPEGGKETDLEDPSVLINKVDIVQRIDHPKEPNTIRFCPKQPNLIGTMAPSGDALVFDRSLFPEMSSSHVPKPQYTLRHHTKEGYALAWSPFLPLTLITGSEDSTIALWDLDNAQSATNVGSTEFKSTILHPERVFGKLSTVDGKGLSSTLALSQRNYHTAVVNSLSWSHDSPHLFGSGSDDRSIIINDLRSANRCAMRNDESSSDCVNSIDFNTRPGFHHTLVSGNADGVVNVWDLRRFDAPVKSIQAHASSVSQVQWSPHFGSVFASGGADRRINVWDLSKTVNSGIIGFGEADESEGPSELVFIHGGHTNRISGFDWHPVLPWTISSVAEDNIVMVWKMAGGALGVSKEDEEEEEVEDVEVEDVEAETVQAEEESGAPVEAEVDGTQTESVSEPVAKVEPDATTADANAAPDADMDTNMDDVPETKSEPTATSEEQQQVGAENKQTGEPGTDLERTEPAAEENSSKAPQSDEAAKMDIE